MPSQQTGQRSSFADRCESSSQVLDDRRFASSQVSFRRAAAAFFCPVGGSAAFRVPRTSRSAQESSGRSPRSMLGNAEHVARRIPDRRQPARAIG
jgi:hypothetical protein